MTLEASFCGTAAVAAYKERARLTSQISGEAIIDLDPVDSHKSLCAQAARA